MKTNRKQQSIFILILTVFVFTSCEKFDDNPTLSNLNNMWKLINIERAEPIQYFSYDSTKCIDDIPYGFRNGNVYELKGTKSQPDNLIDFYVNNEFWTFFDKDSLIIHRRGYEPTYFICKNGEVEGRVSPGFSTIIIKASWKYSHNGLIFTSDINQADTMFINYSSQDSLVLNYLDDQLIFTKSEETNHYLFDY